VTSTEVAGADLVVEDGDDLSVVTLSPEAARNRAAHVRRRSATLRRRTRINAAQATERGGGGTSDPVRMYLREIGRVPLLVAAEEVSLAKRIEAGVEASVQLAELDAAGALGDLPRDEARRLQWLADDGDDAKSGLIQANLRLVV